MMTKVTISLPDSVRNFIKEKVENEGYGTVSEYIRELIRRDQRAATVQTNKKLRVEREPGIRWNEITGSLNDPFPEL